MPSNEWEDDETTQIRQLPSYEAQGPGDQPFLVVLSGTSVGRMVQVSGEMLIGRSPRADIRIEDDGVSREHAKLRRDPDGKVTLTDLGSTNGTWIDEQRLAEPMALEDGMRIRVGTTTILKFGFQDSVEQQFLQHLYASATRDWLTGVHNRRSFVDRLEQEIAWHRRHKQPLALVMFDIDFFKDVNDTWGHPAGDAVLKELAAICVKRCRTEDVVARIGGEEFVILLRRTELEPAKLIADRFRAAIADTVFHTADADVTCTISAGVVSRRGDELTDPDTLMADVDTLLYSAKDRGRNQIVA